MSSINRDATFALAYSEYFDPQKRIIGRNDRATLPFASTTIVGSNAQSSPFHFEQWQYSLSSATDDPFTIGYTTGSPDGSSNLVTSWTRNMDEDVTAAAGFGSTGPTSSNSYTRDAAGRVLTNTHHYQGDSSNGITPPASQTSTYTYRPDGRLSQIVNPDGTHDFTYDERGLMATQTVSGEGTYTYGYDELGRNSYLMYPDGHVRRQQYDELGRINSRCYEYSMGTVRCYTAEYDAVGNPVVMTDPDGTDTITYDSLDRISQLTRTEGGTVVSVEDYAYNALGALKVNAGVVVDDQRPRLDGNGTADAAVPGTFNGQPVVLDGGGRVTSLTGTTFTYAETPWILRSVTPPAPELPYTFGQDSELRRVAHEQGTAAEFYYYEGDDRIAILGQGTSGVVESYLFDGIDHPLRVTRGAATVYYELDLAGNVRGCG